MGDDPNLNRAVAVSIINIKNSDPRILFDGKKPIISSTTKNQLNHEKSPTTVETG